MQRKNLHKIDVWHFIPGALFFCQNALRRQVSLQCFKNILLRYPIKALHSKTHEMVTKTQLPLKSNLNIPLFRSIILVSR